MIKENNLRNLRNNAEILQHVHTHSISPKSVKLIYSFIFLIFFLDLIKLDVNNKNKVTLSNIVPKAYSRNNLDNYIFILEKVRYFFSNNINIIIYISLVLIFIKILKNKKHD